MSNLVVLESAELRVELVPEVGARIISMVDRRTGYEFLWRNQDVPLRREKPGTDYDPNWYGGIDELLPNDPPETIAGIACPDHGELWTAAFDYKQVGSNVVALTAHIPRFNFEVVRVVEVAEHSCRCKSRITSHAADPRPFLWKLHPALKIQPGDQISCSAERFTVADPECSRRTGAGQWEGEIVPEFDGTAEFLYLHGLWNGYISWERGGKKFDVRFDASVFRYAWYFASYGGFMGHHVAVLEPCTTMPMHVGEADLLGQCPTLQPGQSIETTYTYRAIDED